MAKPKKRGQGGSALWWFLLVSIVVHHAMVMTVVRAPDTKRWVRHEVALVEDSDDEAVPDEPEKKLVRIPPEILAAAQALEPVDADDPVKRKPKKLNPDPEEVKPEPKPEQEPEVEAIDPADPKVMKLEGLHFVDVRTNESDEPPPDAKYFAPINSKVDEETRAENTNMDKDDGKSAVGEAGDPSETSGNAEDSLAAHLVEDDPQPAEDSPVTDKPEAPDLIDATPSPAVSKTDDPSGTVAEKTPEAPESTDQPFSLTPDNSPTVELSISDDGEFVDPETGLPLPTYKQSKLAKEKKGGDAAGPDPKLADLDLSYNEMDGVLGADMEDLKKTWKEAKKSKQKGGFTGKIGKVFSQLENFIPDVKPGNQTALNAAYHPFAEYLTAFHRTMHPHWGDGFLVSLALKPNGDPMNDMSLYAKLEIVVLPDGTVGKVTVVKTSGILAYDVAAIDAVYSGEPYPPPPEVIKSYDGKVYLRWGFYRNSSQCGVWNAEPYMITAPKDKKKVKPPSEKKALEGDG